MEPAQTALLSLDAFDFSYLAVPHVEISSRSWRGFKLRDFVCLESRNHEDLSLTQPSQAPHSKPPAAADCKLARKGCLPTANLDELQPLL